MSDKLHLVIVTGMWVRVRLLAIQSFEGFGLFYH